MLREGTLHALASSCLCCACCARSLMRHAASKVAAAWLLCGSAWRCAVELKGITSWGVPGIGCSWLHPDLRVALVESADLCCTWRCLDCSGSAALRNCRSSGAIWQDRWSCRGCGCVPWWCCCRLQELALHGRLDQEYEECCGQTTGSKGCQHLPNLAAEARAAARSTVRRAGLHCLWVVFWHLVSAAYCPMMADACGCC